MKESKLNVASLTDTVIRLADTAEKGAVAYLRTSEPTLINRLCLELSATKGNRVRDWNLFVVDDTPDQRSSFVILGDEAVELRETKDQALIFIINDKHQESGLDGIFSAGREISEVDLIDEYRKALLDISPLKGYLHHVDLASKYSKEVAIAVGRLEVVELIEHSGSLSQFLENLWRIGLWPIAGDTPTNLVDRYLEISKALVKDLLRVSSNSAMPTDRLRSLDIIPNGNEEDLLLVSKFISECDKGRMQDVFINNPLDDKFFVGNWKLELVEQEEVSEIFIEAWRGNNGKATPWSGLSQDGNGELEYIINAEDNSTSKDLTVRWTTTPKTIRKGGVLFNVELFVGDESKANWEVLSSGKNRNDFKIRADVFEIEAGDNFDARVVVSFRDTIREETETFIVRDGDSTKKSGTSSNRTYRTISEFLLEAENSDAFTDALKEPSAIATLGEREIVLLYRDSKKPIKGKIKLPWGWRRCWQLLEQNDFNLGKFTMLMSAAGKLLPSSLEFRPIELDEVNKVDSSIWNAVVKRLRSADNVYGCHLADSQEAINRFANLWKEGVEKDADDLALVNTISVLDESGRIKALILLPESPIRLLFRVYYDQFIEFLSREGKGSELKSIYESVSGNGFPIVFPTFDQNSPYGVMRSCEALDINTQLLVAPDITDDSSLPTQIRRYWYSDDQDNFEAVADSMWQAEQISKEIAATRSVQTNEENQSSLVDLTLLASFGGGDGGTLLTALTMSREGKGVSNPKQIEPDETTPSFSLGMFPSIARKDLANESMELDSIAGKFEDLWELARKSKNEVPQKYRWIFERPSRNTRNPGFSLTWRKGDLKENPNELGGGSTELYHLAIFFSVGSNAAFALEAKEMKINRPRSLLYGLVRTWDTQRIATDGKIITATFYDDLSNAERFDNRRTKNNLADVLGTLEEKVRERIGGNGETITFVKTISDQEQNFIIDAHRYAEKVVILDSGAMEVYRSRGVTNGEYLIGETIANGATVVQSSISAVRTSSLLAIGYKPSMDSCEVANNAESAVRFTIAALQEIPGSSQIYYTDRNDRSDPALSFVLGYTATVQDKSIVGATANEAAVLIPLIDLPNSMRSNLSQNLVETSFAVLRIKGNAIYLGLTLSATEKTFASGASAIRDFMDECHSLWGSVVSLTSSRKRWSDRVALAKVIEQQIGRSRSEQLRPQHYKTIQEKLASLRQLQCDTIPIEFDDTSMDTVITIDFRVGTDSDVNLRYIEISSEHVVDRFIQRSAFQDHLYISRSNDLIDGDTFGVTNRTELEVSDQGFIDDTEFEISVTNENVDSTAIEVSGFTEDYLEKANRLTNPIDLVTIDLVTIETPGKPDVEIQHSDLSTSEPSTLEPTNIVDGAGEMPLPPIHPKEISIEVGSSRSGETVIWQPSVSTNPHMIVTGLSGVGKTTFIMGVVKQLKEQGIAPIVISFHQDVDEIMEGFFGNEMNVSDINNASFNPLYFTESELQTNRYVVNDIANGVSGMLSLLFPNLGDIQIGQFREAIKKQYPKDLASDFDESNQPTLLDVFKRMNRSSDIDKNLMTRLRDLFSYESLFETNSGRSFLHSDHATIIKLSTINSEVARLALLIFSIDGIYREMTRRGVMKEITHALVIDEAHLIRNFDRIPRLAREARKYGVSLVLASQRFNDFDDDVTANAGTAVFFKSNEDDARKVAKHIEHSDQQKEIIDMVRSLENHHAIYYSGGGWQEIITLKRY
ncbi:ATP-binding protein [Acidithrix sp. C25]|uniref:ATP-binding protein n=1 Tax=Acidithrix sp. C25 TaxID=1671482 RepID=UPI00191B90DA|nr:ATP-binding protein [Acidithrix sp. C25]CAG4907784.1 unnamed protein product [Acidithrix sp. C25]